MKKEELKKEIKKIEKIGKGEDEVYYILTKNNNLYEIPLESFPADAREIISNIEGEDYTLDKSGYAKLYIRRGNFFGDTHRPEAKKIIGEFIEKLRKEGNKSLLPLFEKIRL